ncbi:hypothetical protein Hte_002590 [Hypoxylon texense]
MLTTPEPQIEGGISYGEAVDRTTMQPTPGPARNGKFYFDLPQPSSISFSFRPDPMMDDEYQPWFGQLDVKCDDVPLLMREGFYCTTANIIQEEGFIDDITPDLYGSGNPDNPCTITRFWFLRDLQQPPRWVACLQVHAPNDGTLSRFRFENCSSDMVLVAKAWSLSNKLIYYFDALNAQQCINSIYDYMPLKGWWPWPKEDEETIT